MSNIQSDDGNRNALIHFLENRESKATGMLSFCTRHEEFWKARVFLELLWEFEASGKTLVPTPDEGAGKVVPIKMRTD